MQLYECAESSQKARGARIVCRTSEQGAILSLMYLMRRNARQLSKLAEFSAQDDYQAR